MTKFDKKYTQTIVDTVECLRKIIAENKAELSSDTTSEYAKKYLNYNRYLEFAAFILEKIIDPTHGHAE